MLIKSVTNTNITKMHMNIAAYIKPKKLHSVNSLLYDIDYTVSMCDLYTYLSVI